MIASALILPLTADIEGLRFQLRFLGNWLMVSISDETLILEVKDDENLPVQISVNGEVYQILRPHIKQFSLAT